MSLDRIVLIVTIVFFGLVALAYAGGLLTILFSLHPVLGAAFLAILALVIYVIARVIQERVNSPDDDHYDGMKH
ncbi:MAG: hypothetical protein AAF386_04575 [Pseudomonadota bacterium]